MGQARRIRNLYLEAQKAKVPFKEKLKLKLLRIQKSLERNLTAYRYYRVGRLRLNGEVHLKMYDQYSLGKVLSEVGFIQITTTSADKSRIDNWNEYKWLDIEKGKIRKPDSLFMEGVKSLK